MSDEDDRYLHQDEPEWVKDHNEAEGTKFREDWYADLYAKARPAEWDDRFFDADGEMGWCPGQRGWVAAIMAAKKRTPNWSQRWRENITDYDTLPRWPSTLSGIDQRYGGFFGLTSLVAQPGCGKTMLGLSSALQAAATQKWNVKFFAAEVDDDEIMERRDREMRVHTGAIEGADFFELIHVGKGQHLEDFCIDLAEHDPTLPILVCIDSINTMATLTGRDYLKTISEIALWASFARKLSRGAISFLIISETNAKGNSKGEKLEYWSDLCITMKGQKGETGIDFDISKIRRGQHSVLGMLHRDWKTNRFYTREEMEWFDSRQRRARLRIVGDDDDLDF